jgi:uncharacterized membrane protein
MATEPRRRRKRRSSLAQRLRADLMAGLALVLPVILTVFVVGWLVHFIDAKVVPLIPVRLPYEQVAGFGVVAFAIFTVAVGALTRHVLGRRAVHLAEGVVRRVPIARRLHLGAKQIIETVIAKGSTALRRTALVEYPERGIWQVVAITAPVGGEIAARTGEDDLVGLLVPTAPNPITGFLVFCPRRDLRPLDLSIEDGAKLILSAGLVGPPGYAPQGPAGRP